MDLTATINRIHEIVDYDGLFTPEQDKALRDVLSAVYDKGYSDAEAHAAGDFDD